MVAFVMIVRDVLGHGLPKVALAKRNDAIETFPFDGPDEAFSVGIRIRRPPRRLHNPDTAIAQQLTYRRAPLGVPITNHYAMPAQQSVIRHRQRATDLQHEQLIGMWRRPDYAHPS